MSLALKVHSLTCFVDYKCLFESLEFEVNKSQAFCLVGSNGTGKTTLLSILAGLFTNYQGVVTYSPHLSPPIFVEDRLGLFLNMTPKENLSWYAKLWGLEIAPEVMENALGKMSVLSSSDMYCNTLSSGQRRRVALARLLMANADIWLLDEPFNALDAQGIEDFLVCMRAFVHSGGTIIWTNHMPLQEDISSDDRTFYI